MDSQSSGPFDSPGRTGFGSSERQGVALVGTRCDESSQFALTGLRLDVPSSGTMAMGANPRNGARWDRIASSRRALHRKMVQLGSVPNRGQAQMESAPKAEDGFT
jgi:hypothetical protein